MGGMMEKVSKRAMYAFAGVQALFVVWIVWALAGVASADRQELCGGLADDPCTAAVASGTLLGVLGIFAIWVIVDVALVVAYMFYKNVGKR